MSIKSFSVKFNKDSLPYIQNRTDNNQLSAVGFLIKKMECGKVFNKSYFCAFITKSHQLGYIIGDDGELRYYFANGFYDYSNLDIRVSGEFMIVLAQSFMTVHRDLLVFRRNPDIEDNQNEKKIRYFNLFYGAVKGLQKSLNPVHVDHYDTAMHYKDSILKLVQNKNITSAYKKQADLFIVIAYLDGYLLKRYIITTYQMWLQKGVGYKTIKHLAFVKYWIDDESLWNFTTIFKPTPYTTNSWWLVLLILVSLIIPLCLIYRCVCVSQQKKEEEDFQLFRHEKLDKYFKEGHQRRKEQKRREKEAKRLQKEANLRPRAPTKKQAAAKPPLVKTFKKKRTLMYEFDESTRRSSGSSVSNLMGRRSSKRDKKENKARKGKRRGTRKSDFSQSGSQDEGYARLPDIGSDMDDDRF